MMTPVEYEFVARTFAQVCDLPEDERARALDEACREQPQLRCEVEAMLVQEAGGEGFAEPPAFVAGMMDAFLPTLDSAGPTAVAGTAHGPHEDFAGYELLEQIGRGGMGVVFRARQRQPDRIVAVKMIRAGNSLRPPTSSGSTPRPKQRPGWITRGSYRFTRSASTRASTFSR